MEKGGRILLSLEVLPHWKAQICKVGLGRDEPNINPYLPPPIGRFQWSLNPFTMLVIKLFIFNFRTNVLDLNIVERFTLLAAAEL